MLLFGKKWGTKRIFNTQKNFMEKFLFWTNLKKINPIQILYRNPNIDPMFTIFCIGSVLHVYRSYIGDFPI
jgi:hypothetical protein